MPSSVGGSEISDLYRKPDFPGSLGGVKKFSAALRRAGKKISARALKRRLQEDDVYQLHKPSRKHFPRRPTIVQGIDHLWQVDLSDVSSIKEHNDGNRFILFVIDAFSKYAWAVPLKNKTAATLTATMRELFRATKRKPLHVMSDKGSEFVNRPLKTLLDESDVRFYTSQNEETKASIVERLQRTVKTKMFRYFTDKNTLRYVEVLPDLMLSYNKTHHRSIGMAPADVDRTVDDDVRRRLAEKWSATAENRAKTSAIKVGDSVRISIARAPFRKGYLPQWTEEIFTVSEKKKTRPTTFRVQDYAGDPLRGTFYAEELQKVPARKDRVYRVESVLRRRTRRGRKELLVKWMGYPDKFNSWIAEKDLA